MLWLTLLIAIAGVTTVRVVVGFNRTRTERRLVHEMRTLLAVAPASDPRPPIAELPPPVERYRQVAVGDHVPVRTLRLRHGGTFRLSPSAKALPIRGVQLFAADPPGFVWFGRVHVGPGVWIDARDMAVAGEGQMRVLVDDTVCLTDARGPHLDLGAALRLLAEMVWYPTSLFDGRCVRWSEIDAEHARATLRFGAHDVSGVFEFGPDGLPVRMSAERFNDKGELLPWGGTYRDWRIVSGMHVPFEAEVSWQLATGAYSYAHWRVEAMEFDEGGASDSTLLRTLRDDLREPPRA